MRHGRVRTIEAKLGLVYINGKPMTIDSLWKNGTAAQAYWLWRAHADSVSRFGHRHAQTHE